jgi:hypothetical protein
VRKEAVMIWEAIRDGIIYEVIRDIAEITVGWLFSGPTSGYENGPTGDLQQ